MTNIDIDIDIDIAAVLAMFKAGSKAHERAAAALACVAEAQAARGWQPGDARRCWAALKAPKAPKALLKTGVDDLTESKAVRSAGFHAHMILMFGAPYQHRLPDLELLSALELTAPQRAAVEHCRKVIAAFGPVWEVMQALDCRQVRPQFAVGMGSAAHAMTLRDLGVTADAATVDVPPIEYEERWVVTDGVGRMVPVAVVIWPAGTVHGLSRHSGTGRCHACGRAIRVGHFVPLMVRDTSGLPRSLWVGRDCAKRLFQITMKGDLVLAGK